MEGPLAPGTANGIRTPSPAPPTIDPQILVDYLVRLLEVNLGAAEADLRGLGSLLSPARLQDTLQRCTRFAQESQTVLYVLKERVDESRIDQRDSLNGNVLPADCELLPTDGI